MIMPVKKAEFVQPGHFAGPGIEFMSLMCAIQTPPAIKVKSPRGLTTMITARPHPSDTGLASRQSISKASCNMGLSLAKPTPSPTSEDVQLVLCLPRRRQIVQSFLLRA
jgi:hypothetical protein